MTKLQQTDTTASFGAAIHAYRQQNYAEAERIGRQIIGLNAADKRGWLLLGAVLRDVQQVAEAEACFRKVIALDPSNADGCANLGLCCDDLGRTDEGIAWQEKALAIMPQHVGALVSTVLADRGQGTHTDGGEPQGHHGRDTSRMPQPRSPAPHTPHSTAFQPPHPSRKSLGGE